MLLSVKEVEIEVRSKVRSEQLCEFAILVRMSTIIENLEYTEKSRIDLSRAFPNEFGEVRPQLVLMLL